MTLVHSWKRHLIHNYNNNEYNAAAIKPIITPVGIELNKHIVALRNINSMFKYIGVKSNSQIVKDYTFYATKIQDRDVFVVSGALLRRTEHEIEDNGTSLTFPRLICELSWYGSTINLDIEPSVNNFKMIPTISSLNNHYRYHLVPRGYEHLNFPSLYYSDFSWNSLTVTCERTDREKEVLFSICHPLHSVRSTTCTRSNFCRILILTLVSLNIPLSGSSSSISLAALTTTIALS